MTQRPGRLETLANINNLVAQHTADLKGAIAPPSPPPPTADEKLLEAFGGPAAALPTTDLDRQIEEAF